MPRIECITCGKLFTKYKHNTHCTSCRTKFSSLPSTIILVICIFLNLDSQKSLLLAKKSYSELLNSQLFRIVYGIEATNQKRKVLLRQKLNLPLWRVMSQENGVTTVGSQFNAYELRSNFTYDILVSNYTCGETCDDIDVSNNTIKIRIMENQSNFLMVGFKLRGVQANQWHKNIRIGMHNFGSDLNISPLNAGFKISADTTFSEKLLLKNTSLKASEGNKFWLNRIVEISADYKNNLFRFSMDGILVAERPYEFCETKFCGFIFCGSGTIVERLTS